MQAPELKASHWIDLNGEPCSFSLAENRGKWVIIYCFQHWCEGCHIYGFPALQSLVAAFADNPMVEVLCIQTVFEGFEENTLDKIRQTQLRYRLPITMGHDAGDPDTDPKPATMRNFGTGGTPWTILIQPDGDVVFSDFHINADNLIEFLNQDTVSLKTRS